MSSDPLNSSESSDHTNWEQEKLNHNLDIQAIPYNERLSSLLPRYIPTLADLRKIVSTSAIIGFDTESVPHCYKTTDVGLALLPELNLTQSSKQDDPDLHEFFVKNRVKAISFKINGRYNDFTKSDIYRPMEPLRFGQEHFVEVEDLEAELFNRLELVRRKLPEKQLVLVGLSLQNDFERLCLEFPGIIGFFSGWIDLSTLIKAESLARPKINTGVGTALSRFGYRYLDTGLNRRHQAANDAVRTLAVLHGLMDPKNVADLVRRQNPQVYRAILHVDGKDLPSAIDSTTKLALAFQEFRPIGVEADCNNAEDKQKRLDSPSMHTERMTRGSVWFNTRRELQAFISATNGQKCGGEVLRVVRLPSPEQIQARIRAVRRERRVRALNIDWSGTFHDTFAIEEEETQVLVDSDATSGHSIKRPGSEKRPCWLPRFFRRITFRKHPSKPKY